MALSLETTIKRGHQEIVSQVDAERGMLKVRELSFARLIAEDGFTQHDAYVEAFQPSPEAKPESIQQMACRIANKPAVKAEIQRIENDIKELSMSKESRLGIAFDGPAVNQRIALELFAIIVSTKQDSLRVKCMEIMGRMKHVDSFVGTGAIIDEATKKMGAINANNAGEARAAVKAKILQLIQDKNKKEPVEVTSEHI